MANGIEPIGPLRFGLALDGILVGKARLCTLSVVKAFQKQLERGRSQRGYDIATGNRPSHGIHSPNYLGTKSTD